MINKKKRLIGIFLIVSLVFTVSLISAVGVSMYYYEGKPLKISPGSSKTVEVASLIASHETQDKDVKIELLEGSDIASVVDEDISVKAGSVDNVIKLKISIPEGVAEGMEYLVRIKTSELTPPEEGGMVGFTTSKVTNMLVFVQETGEEEKEPTAGISWAWIILGVLVVVVVVVVIKFALKNKETSTK